MINEATIVHAIRKSVSRVATQALGGLPFPSSTQEILEVLDVNFKNIKNDAINWQVFYNAGQTKKGNLLFIGISVCATCRRMYPK